MRFAALVVAAAAWSSEPAGQQYTLRHGDAVLYWKADATPPTYGQCCYLWGYHPVMRGPNGIVAFADVEWTYGSP